MWMVRNGQGNYATEFLEKGLVAVGWSQAGSLQNLKMRGQIIDRVKSIWPEYKPMKAVVSGSQLDKIANVMQVGDRVITYDPSTRIYHIGKITGGYEFVSGAEDLLANRRAVTWEANVDRDKLSVPTKNSLGSTLTIFEIPENVERELDAVIAGKKDDGADVEALASNEADADTQLILADLQSKAKEFIKDKLVQLDWDEMQEVIAGLLRAMSYKTSVSPQGSDRGKDIVASPDGLGLEQPRIVVEVKHRPNERMGSQQIRSFLGGRHKDDRGLYVSTGGFSTDAKYEADRASIPLTLMDMDQLVGHDLLPNLPSFISRVRSGFGPCWGGLRTRSV